MTVHETMNLKGAAQGAVHSAILSGAVADIVLPVEGMWLYRVVVGNPTNPGSVSYNFNGTDLAHFPTQATGQGDWKVAFQVKGSRIPAASLALNGASTGAVFHFCTAKPTDSPPIEAYRAVRATRTDGAAATGSVTLNFPSMNRPRAVMVLAANGASLVTVTLPAQNGFQQVTGAYGPNVGVLPTPLQVGNYPPANAFTVTLASGGPGAQTTDIYAFY